MAGLGCGGGLGISSEDEEESKFLSCPNDAEDERGRADGIAHVVQASCDERPAASHPHEAESGGDGSTEHSTSEENTQFSDSQDGPAWKAEVCKDTAMLSS
jgi:hypothetical protein